MQKSLELLNEIIKMEEARDFKLKETIIKLGGKYEDTQGDSQILFHLKALRELMETEKLTGDFFETLQSKE